MSQDFFNSCEVVDAIESVEQFLKQYFKRRSKDVSKLSPQLLEAIEYSIFSGGKRFRPAVCLSINAKATAFAAALEMVHTYSLIHDDLPCMDNDDERRGRPTNHKKFGEPLALLAGDALLTESFLVISEAYEASVALRLVKILSRASGMSGMVGGQAMDMKLGRPISDTSALTEVHLAKTAELIAVATEGAGVIDGASEELCKQLRKVGLLLGFCFQLKDDLLDGPQDRSEKSFLYFLKTEDLQTMLSQKTTEGLALISQLPRAYQKLSPFFDFNKMRTH